MQDIRYSDGISKQIAEERLARNARDRARRASETPAQKEERLRKRREQGRRPSPRQKRTMNYYYQEAEVSS